MLGAKEIEQVIPHRGHMRLVDEIREYNENSGWAFTMSAMMNSGVRAISRASRLCRAYYR